MTKKPARILSIILMIFGIGMAVFGVRLALASRNTEPVQYETSSDADTDDQPVDSGSPDLQTSSSPEVSASPAQSSESTQNPTSDQTVQDQGSSENASDNQNSENNVVEEDAQ